MGRSEMARHRISPRTHKGPYPSLVGWELHLLGGESLSICDATNRGRVLTIVWLVGLAFIRHVMRNLVN